MVPARHLPKQHPRDEHEDHDGDALLHHFELDQAEAVRADTIGRYLK